jgi:hypothetical protein
VIARKCIARTAPCEATHRSSTSFHNADPRLFLGQLVFRIGLLNALGRELDPIVDLPHR